MHPISEIASIGFTLMTYIASGLILAEAPAPQQFALQWFLLPLLGALAASVAAIFLNPAPEARKTVLARSICGVVVGTAVPKVVSLIHPAIRELALDPAMAFLAGFGFGVLGYVLSKPFMVRLYERSGDIASDLEAIAEKKITSVTVTKSETTTSTPPQQ